MVVYEIKPCPKPRMLRSDKWKRRKPVLKYWDFVSKVEALCIDINPNGFWVEFVIAVPKSIPKKERARRLSGDRRNTIKPDKDNLEKALLDALYQDDAHCWNGGCSKLWGETDMIIVWDLQEYIEMKYKIKGE